MSIRAHRVNTLEYASSPTFNCSHETELFDFLLDDERTQDGRNMDGSGIVEVKLETLQEALNSRELQLDEDTRSDLQADMASAREKGRDYILYDCF